MKSLLLTPESDPEIKAIAFEYWELASCQDLSASEAQANRIEQILSLANQDEYLGFLLNELDHFLGHRLGLLEEEDRNSYKNQEVLLREYIEALSEQYLAGNLDGRIAKDPVSGDSLFVNGSESSASTECGITAPLC